MRYSTIALAAMPGFFALASGLGSFTIKNSCGSDIHYVHDIDTCGEVFTVAAGESSDPCPYESKQDGSQGGPSVKIALVKTICSAKPPPITQFEYTLSDFHDMVFTDLSNINGIPYPFMEGGVRLTSSDKSVSVSCAAGIEDCSEAYNTPDQNEATKSAPQTASLLVELCHDKQGIVLGGTSSGASSGGSTGGSSPAPASPPQADVEKPAVQQAQAPASSSAPPPPPPPPSSSPSPPPAVSSPSTPPPPPPSPSSSPKPSPAQQEADVEVIVTVTETAPVVWVTEHVGGQQKRDRDHIHQHVHNKIHKKRHGGG